MALEELVVNIKLIEPKITHIKLTIKADIEMNGIIQSPAQEYTIEHDVNIPIDKFKELLEKLDE